MNKIPHLLSALLISVLFISSCKKDEPADPIIPNEEEVITTLHYILTPVGEGVTVELTFQDLDGDGGDPPVISGGTLDSNTVYTGSLELLNELVDPAENLTEEIADEAEDHQFFFHTSIPGVEITYNDIDPNENPIGLSTMIETGGSGSGFIIVILRHEPDKYAFGVADGMIENAGGETDLEVTFNVDVE